MKTFVFTQFDYFPIVWMRQNRKFNYKLDR